MKISIRAGLVLGGVSIGMKAVVCMSKQFVNSEALINKKPNGEEVQVSEMELRKVQSEFVYVKKSKNQTETQRKFGYVKKSKNQSEFVYMKKGTKLKEKQKKMKVNSSVKKNKKLKSGKKSEGTCYNGNSTTLNEQPEEFFNLTVSLCKKAENGKTFTITDLDKCVQVFLTDFAKEKINVPLPAYSTFSVNEKRMYVGGSGYQLRYKLEKVEFANIVFHFNLEGYIYYVSGEAVKTDKEVCKIALLAEAEAKQIAVREFSKDFKSNNFKDVSQYNITVEELVAFDPKQGETKAFNITLELKDVDREVLRNSDECKDSSSGNTRRLQNTPLPTASDPPSSTNPPSDIPSSTPISPPIILPSHAPSLSPTRGDKPPPVITKNGPMPLMNECFPFVQNYYLNRCTSRIFLDKPSSHQVVKTLSGRGEGNRRAPPRVLQEKVGNYIDIQKSIQVRNCLKKEPSPSKPAEISSICVGRSASNTKAKEEMDKADSYAKSFIKYLFVTFGVKDDENKKLLTNAFTSLKLNVKWGETNQKEAFFDTISKQVFFIHNIFADVVAHEMTHSLLQDSNLSYSQETGALIESFGDILGVALKNQINPGKNIYKAVNTNSNIYDSLHDMVSYYEDKIFDDNAKKKSEFSHQNGGISSTAFYLLAQGGKHHKGRSDIVNKGIGVANATEIFFDAFMGCMTTYAGFHNARYCTINAASDDNKVHVHKAWESVGVTCVKDLCATTSKAKSIKAKGKNKGSQGARFLQDEGSQNSNNECKGITRIVRGQGVIIQSWDKRRGRGRGNRGAPPQ